MLFAKASDPLVKSRSIKIRDENNDTTNRSYNNGCLILPTANARSLDGK